MKKALIIGYPGWLASELAKKLCADNMVVDGLGLQSPAQIGANVLRQYYCVDVSNHHSLKNASIKFETYDVIINCASIIHPKRPIDFFKVNSLSSLSLVIVLNDARFSGEYIYISSNAAQGHIDTGVIGDENTPDLPKSVYGKSKLLAENFLKLKAKFNFNILRPCMFYSSNVPQRHQSVRKWMKISVFPTFSGNDVLRSVTSVSDICKTCLALCEGVAKRQVFYICDPHIISTNQVIVEMSRKAGVQNLRLIRLPSFIAKVAHVFDNLLCKYGIYIMSLHLLGESDWNVGYSSRKASKQLGINFGNYIGSQK